MWHSTAVTGTQRRAFYCCEWHSEKGSACVLTIFFYMYTLCLLHVHPSPVPAPPRTTGHTFLCSFFSVSIFEHTESHSYCPCVHACGIIHWAMRNPPVSVYLGRVTPSFPGHQLLIAPQIRVVPQEPHLSSMLDGFVESISRLGQSVPGS